MIAFGLDIGGTAVKAAVLRDGATVRTGRSFRYEKPLAAELAEALRAAAGDLRPGVGAVGLCVPGLRDESGQVVTASVNVPGLVGVPLGELLRQALAGGLPRRPIVLTDAHAAAYHVYRTRGLRGRLLSLSIGTGVGAAVLDDGKPLHVDGESPGHFGQIDVSLDGDPPVGPDGGAGGLEGYVGGPALAARYGPDVAAAIEGFTGAEPAVRALARAVRIAHAIYRPHHVCLAGGTGVRLRQALPALRGLVETSLTRIARPGWTLQTADDDFDAARGAALWAAGHAESPPAPEV